MALANKDIFESTTGKISTTLTSSDGTPFITTDVVAASITSTTNWLTLTDYLTSIINRIAALEAKHATVNYTVTFNANGGSGTMSPQIFIGGVTQTLTSNAYTRTNYTFSGWSTSSSATSATYGDEQAITVTSNMTLYAVWNANSKYINTLHYAASGASNVPADQTETVTYPKTHSEFTISNTTPLKTGYKFVYWEASDDVDEHFYSGNTIGVNYGGAQSGATRTVNAIWEARDYSIIINYNENAGSDTVSNMPGIQSVDVTYPNTTHTFTVSSTTPTRSGYTFSNWNTNSSGTGTTYKAGSSITAGTTNTTGDQTVNLYAVWTEAAPAYTLTDASGNDITAKYKCTTTQPSTTNTYATYSSLSNTLEDDTKIYCNKNFEVWWYNALLSVWENYGGTIKYSSAKSAYYYQIPAEMEWFLYITE